MDAQTRAGPDCGAGDGDIDRAVVSADTPDLGRGAVAHDATGGQDRRHLAASGAGHWTYLVDATPHRDQPPALHPARQRASVQAGGRELRRGHDPMLAGRETHYHPVAGVHFVDLAHLPPARSTFGTHTVRFVDLTRDAILKSTKCTLEHAH